MHGLSTIVADDVEVDHTEGVVTTTEYRTYLEPQLEVQIEDEVLEVVEFGESDQSLLPDTPHEYSKISSDQLKKLVQQVGDEPGAFTHWVAVKSKVPVKYTPHMKSKTVKVVTTEELGDDVLSLDPDIDGQKPIYYPSVEIA